MKSPVPVADRCLERDWRSSEERSRKEMGAKRKGGKRERDEHEPQRGGRARASQEVRRVRGGAEARGRCSQGDDIAGAVGPDRTLRACAG